MAAGNRKTPGAAAGRQQKRFIWQRGPVLETNDARCRVDGRCAAAEGQANSVTLGIRRGQPVLRKYVRPREHVLGQRWTLIGKMHLVPDEVDRAVETGVAHRDDGG